MPLKQDRLERSFKVAKNSLEAFEKKLSDDKVNTDDFKKNPRWRELDASCRKIQERMNSLADLISRGNQPEESA